MLKIIKIKQGFIEYPCRNEYYRDFLTFKSPIMKILDNKNKSLKMKLTLNIPAANIGCKSS
jgi:hypothetical protein